MSQTKQMLRWQTAQDGLDKLVRSECPILTLGKDEVLVEIHAVSLNYRDTEVVMGLYTHHKSIANARVIPCSDTCGTVVAVGDRNHATWNIGDRVLSIFIQTHLTGQIKEPDMASGLGLPRDGVLQTHRVFPANALVKAPDHLADEEALHASNRCSHCMDVDELVQGNGQQAIITSSSDEKLSRSRSLGASHTINYRKSPQWQDVVMEITNQQGADHILETGGAQTLRKSLDCVAFGGTIACIGYLSGKEDDPNHRMNLNVLALRRNVTLKGIINGPKDRFEDMLRFYQAKKIKPVVDKVFSFDEACEALQYLYSGSHYGKVVIRVKP